MGHLSTHTTVSSRKENRTSGFLYNDLAYVTCMIFRPLVLHTFSSSNFHYKIPKDEVRNSMESILAHFYYTKSHVYCVLIITDGKSRYINSINIIYNYTIAKPQNRIPWKLTCGSASLNVDIRNRAITFYLRFIIRLKSLGGKKKFELW